jgi:hypothetical protein
MTFINISRLIVTNKKKSGVKDSKGLTWMGIQLLIFLEGRSYRNLYIELQNLIE